MIPLLLFASREAIHDSTGFTPFDLVYGRHVRGPLDIIREQWEGTEDFPVSVAEYMNDLYQRMSDIAEIAAERDMISKERNKNFHDQNARTRDMDVGDSVLLLAPQCHSKLEASYQGPYQILEKITPVTYLINVPGRKEKDSNCV